jgi:hypothetical protein
VSGLEFWCLAFEFIDVCRLCIFSLSVRPSVQIAGMGTQFGMPCAQSRVFTEDFALLTKVYPRHPSDMRSHLHHFGWPVHPLDHLTSGEVSTEQFLSKMNSF